MSIKLSPRQEELMVRVALKRYRVERNFDMGFFQSASIVVSDAEGTGVDRSFRPVTADVLAQKSLTRNERIAPGAALIKPTPAGIEWFREYRKTHPIKKHS